MFPRHLYPSGSDGFIHRGRGLPSFLSLLSYLFPERIFMGFYTNSFQGVFSWTCVSKTYSQQHCQAQISRYLAALQVDYDEVPPHILLCQCPGN